MTEHTLAQRYTLIRVLGEGGMARVYEAEDRRLGRRVAVKVLLPQFTGDPEFLRRFEQEGRIAASLSHPNIVGIYDVGQDGQFHFIVMELVDGQTLKEAITKSAPLPVAETVRVASEVCAALSVAHARGMVHRDIKPQNILLTAGGQVKVADFGIARRTASTTMTQTGTVLGSVHYLSPEQAQGLEATPRSDLYALGVTLYEMLTGRVPFTADNPVAVAMQQVQATPVPPRQLNRAIPPALEGIVLRLLAKNPAERFPDAMSVIVALRLVLGQAGGSTRIAGQGPHVAPPLGATAPMSPSPRGRTASVGSATGFAQPVITQVTPPSVPPAAARSGRRSILAGVLVGGIGALAIIAVLVLLSSGGGLPGIGGAATPTPTLTSTPVPTATPTSTVPRPVVVPTRRPRPTKTPLPTKTPRPTDTPTPLPTVTESASFTPTPTPVPPTFTQTATDTPTFPPTATWTPLPSPTPFPTIPPDTATPRPTETPRPTDTPVPPTNTVEPPTNTPVPTFPLLTDTPTPGALPTLVGSPLPAGSATPGTVSTATGVGTGTPGTPGPVLTPAADVTPVQQGTPGLPALTPSAGSPVPVGTGVVSDTPVPTATFFG